MGSAAGGSGAGTHGGELDRPEVMLLVRAWLERRDLPGLTLSLRALVTDVLTQERWGADNVERLHSVLDERLQQLAETVSNSGHDNGEDG